MSAYESAGGGSLKLKGVGDIGMKKSWKGNFSACTSEYVGYVSSLDQLQNLLQDFQLETNSHFAIRCSKKNFGKEPDLTNWHGLIHWKDAHSKGYPRLENDGIPFLIMGTRKMECQHGPSRKSNKTEPNSVPTKGQHDDLTKMRRRAKGTKKMGCKSAIYIRHIVKLPEYQSGEVVQNAYTRDIISCQIKHCMRQYPDELKIDHQFHVQLPKEHSNHSPDEVSNFTTPIDKRLVAYMHQRGQEGMYGVREMKIVLEDYLRMELFKDKSLPPRTNTRYWPTTKQINNHMAFAAKKTRKKKKKEAKKILEQISSVRDAESNEENHKAKRDRRTPAQRAFDKIQEQRQTERVLEKASKKHKERVNEFNAKLDTLTEHFDIPKVSWTK